MAERYRFHEDGYVYFVTYSVVEWLPVFVTEATCKIVTDSFNFCHRTKGLRINCFVIMPTHLHAIVFAEDFDAQRLEATLVAFRKFTGRQLLDYSARHLPACFGDRFRVAAGSDRQRRLWQPTQHPESIETEKFWQQKADYIHENPCRKGLVRRAVDWRFSSAPYWLTDGQAQSDVRLTPILW